MAKTYGSNQVMTRTFNGVHGSFGVFRVKIAHCLAHDEAELDFVVHVHTTGAEHGTLAREEDGGRRLQEEEGLLGTGAVELGNVVAATCEPCSPSILSRLELKAPVGRYGWEKTLTYA